MYFTPVSDSVPYSVTANFKDYTLYYKFYCVIVKYAYLVKYHEVLCNNVICNVLFSINCCFACKVAEAEIRVTGACSPL